MCVRECLYMYTCVFVDLTFFLSLMEPFPLTMILHPVSASSCLAVSPRGPKIRPTKLNCNTQTHTDLTHCICVRVEPYNIYTSAFVKSLFASTTLQCKVTDYFEALLCREHDSSYSSVSKLLIM